MQREREKKSWRDIDRGRDRSYHSEVVEKREAVAKQNAAAKQYRAALEALFEKKPEAVEKIERIMPTVVLPKATPAEAGSEGNKRQELLRKIATAQGSKAISDAIDAFLKAGNEFPDDQEVFLQMLEHKDEARVREAIVKLEHLIAGQLPKRKPVMVQRLKRIEEHAEDATTREAAAQLRRKVA